MTTFDLPLLSAAGLLMLAAIALVPGLLVYPLLRVARTPRPGRMALIVALAPLPLYGFVVWQLADARVQLDDDALVVAGGFYETRVPYADIAPDGLVVGGPGEVPRLGMRTKGIGLADAAYGWFRGSGSGDGDRAARRVFAAYNGDPRSVFVATRGDHDLLLSPADADRFLDELRGRLASSR